jgi:hypothetical protein
VSNDAELEETSERAVEGVAIDPEDGAHPTATVEGGALPIGGERKEREDG